MYMVKRWKMIVILVLSLLLTGLVYVGGLLAQIEEEEINFEVMATVIAKDGDTLWDLAQKYYRDPFKWTIIKDVNKIPNEYTIPIGTVVYIPVIPLKKTAVEPEIVEEKTPPVAEEKLLAEIEKLREELSRIKGDFEICKEQNDKFRKELKDKDATIKDLSGMLDNIKAALDKMKADTESELEAQAREMRAAARKHEEELSKARSDKDKLIDELEAELRKCRRSIGELEMLRDELKAKIRMAEVAERKPPAPVKKKPVDERAKVAAVAAVIIGSIIWIASR